MPIEASDALLKLESFSQKMGRQAIDTDLFDRPVFAKPLTVSEMEKLMKHSGMEYNLRLCVASLVYDDDTPVLKETDLFRLRELKGMALPICQLANQIAAQMIPDPGSVKN